MIAVVMGSPDYKVRFEDAKKLLDYGYSVSHLYADENKDKLNELRIIDSIQNDVPVTYETEFRYLDINGNDLSKVEKKINLPENAQAPVKKGETAGSADYYLNGSKIGSVNILFSEDVDKAEYKDYFVLVLRYMLL